MEIMCPERFQVGLRSGSGEILDKAMARCRSWADPWCGRAHGRSQLRCRRRSRPRPLLPLGQGIRHRCNLGSVQRKEEEGDLHLGSGSAEEDMRSPPPTWPHLPRTATSPAGTEPRPCASSSLRRRWRLQVRTHDFCTDMFQ
jgi:hypothetical protein